MTKGIFEHLWNTMDITNTTAVDEFVINGQIYWGYSQSVPENVSDDQVRFAIFFLKPKELSQGTNN